MTTETAFKCCAECGSAEMVLATDTKCPGCGAKYPPPKPCHCYDHCEDDDEGVPRRPDCRKLGGTTGNK